MAQQLLTHPVVPTDEITTKSQRSNLPTDNSVYSTGTPQNPKEFGSEQKTTSQPPSYPTPQTQNPPIGTMTAVGHMPNNRAVSMPQQQVQHSQLTQHQVVYQSVHPSHRAPTHMQTYGTSGVPAQPSNMMYGYSAPQASIPLPTGTYYQPQYMVRQEVYQSQTSIERQQQEPFMSQRLPHQQQFFDAVNSANQEREHRQGQYPQHTLSPQPYGQQTPYDKMSREQEARDRQVRGGQRWERKPQNVQFNERDERFLVLSEYDNKQQREQSSNCQFYLNTGSCPHEGNCIWRHYHPNRHVVEPTLYSKRLLDDSWNNVPPPTQRYESGYSRGGGGWKWNSRGGRGWNRRGRGRGRGSSRSGGRFSDQKSYNFRIDWKLYCWNHLGFGSGPCKWGERCWFKHEDPRETNSKQPLNNNEELKQASDSDSIVELDVESKTETETKTQPEFEDESLSVDSVEKPELQPQLEVETSTTQVVVETTMIVPDIDPDIVDVQT